MKQKLEKHRESSEIIENRKPFVSKQNVFLSEKNNNNNKKKKKKKKKKKQLLCCIFSSSQTGLRYRLVFPCRAEILFCNSTFDWSYANEASLKRNYSGVPLVSKVYYECDTLIILRDTLIILRATLNNLRATLIILRATLNH